MGSSMFSQIIPGLGIAGMPLVGGPVIAPVPKAQQNVTTFPGVQAPHVPYVDPAALMNALANTQNVQSEVEQRKQQNALLKAQVGLLSDPSALRGRPSPTLPSQSAGYAAPDVATAPTVAPSAVTNGGGEGAAPGAFSPEVEDAVSAAANQYGIDPSVLRAQVHVESGGNPAKVNKDTGTIGLGQLGPEVIQKFGVTDPTNPYQNAYAAAAYLREGLDKYGNYNDALKYYYGGPDEAKWGDQTQAYPGKVAAFVPKQVPGPNDQLAANTAPISDQTIANAVNLPPNVAGAMTPVPGAAIGGRPTQLAMADTGTQNDMAASPLSAAPQATPIPGRPLSPQEKFRQQIAALVSGGTPSPPPVAGTNTAASAPVVVQAGGPSPGAALTASPTPLGASSPQQVPSRPANMPSGAMNFGAAGLPAPPPPPAARPDLMQWYQDEMTRAGALNSIRPGLGNTIEKSTENDPQWKAYQTAIVKDMEARTGLPFQQLIESQKGRNSVNVSLGRSGWMLDEQSRPVPIPGFAQQKGAIAGEEETARNLAPRLMPTINPNTLRTEQTVVNPLSLPGAPPSTTPVPAPMVGGNTVAPQAAPKSPQSVITALSPQEAAYEQHTGETRGKSEQDTRQANIDAGSAAQTQQATLSIMQRDAPNFYSGPFADHVQAAKELIRLLPGGDAVADSVASYESFNKNMGQLTRQAVKDTSPRAAVQEFKLISAALPNPEMSPMGLQRVLNEFQGLNDYKIAKAQAQNVWEGSHGGPGRVAGFETDWQGNVSPYAFIVARMTPNDRQMLFNQVGATNTGRAELQHLQQQIQYIQQSGLSRFLQ